MKPIKKAEFTEQNLQLLKALERKAYENTSMAMMQHYSTWEQVANYCDCTLDELQVYLSDKWYILLAEHEDYIEFVDLASITNQTPLFQVLNIVEQYDKLFVMDCRENTSYRMIQALEQSGRIQLEEDESYERDGETFHEIEARLVARRTLHR